MKKTTSLIAVAMAACIHGAAATTIGLSGGPIVTTWDSFPSVAFAGDAPDSGSGHITAGLTSAMAGGMVLGGGDRLYAGAGAAANAFDLGITGTATIPLTEVGLVLKYTPPSVGVALDFFTVALNGQAATSVTLLENFTESGREYFVYHWSWAGAALSGSAIDMDISSRADHVSLDAVQLVPEPGSAALGMVGLTLLALRRRKA